MKYIDRIHASREKSELVSSIRIASEKEQKERESEKEKRVFETI